jgi:hypothetical protein
MKGDISNIADTYRKIVSIMKLLLDRIVMITKKLESLGGYKKLFTVILPKE